MRDECKNLKGRLRDLCEGMGLDGRPTPLQEDSDSYRAMINLPPLPIIENIVDNKNLNCKKTNRQNRTRVNNEPNYIEPVKLLSSIGTNLKAIFARRVGVIPCGWCANKIKQLDSMSYQMVMDSFDLIIYDIYNNAKTQGPWWIKIGIKLDNLTGKQDALRVINECLTEACEMEK